MKLLILCLLLSTSVLGQTTFRLNGASKFVDLELDVGSCAVDHLNLCGPLKVSVYRKNRTRAFQTITLPNTSMWGPVPKANITRRYDDQSTINVGDFNFDGFDDLAICDGANGGYGGPSYRVYLYSKTKMRFAFSRSYTRMNYGGLGMFETDRKKKMHYVFSKSGCCYHQTDGYDVHRGRPRKVYELIETSAYGDGSEVEVSTSKLIRGRWRTWVKHVKASAYYMQ